MKRSVRIVVTGLAVAATFIAQPYRLVMVNGSSMTPTYQSGNFVVTSRFAPTFHRGDAVVFNRDGETLVKRVAFVPGDRILQFKFLGEWMVPNNDFVVRRAKHQKMPRRLWEVPQGQLYVLGDNSGLSIDSRSFGTISESSVLGKVCTEPKPELIRGFAGSAEVDDSQVVVRSEPLQSREALLVKK